MVEAGGPRPGHGGTRSATGLIEQILTELRAKGHAPWPGEHGQWFTHCLACEKDLVRITDGTKIELQCLRRYPCTQEQVAEALGINVSIGDGPSAKERLRAHIYDSVQLDKIPDPEWLIDGILSKDTLTWIYGKRGHGKSLVALDMAGCVASEPSWQGYQVPRNASVLYLVAEGARGTRKRVRAWERAAGRPRHMTGVQFLTIPVSVQDSVHWTALVEICAEMQTALVVLDTQARITPGMEENSNREMGQFVARLDELRRATGACVLVVHHAGHGGDHARGASSLEAAADCVIKVSKPSRESPYLEITSEKQKDAADFDTINLRMVESPDPGGDPSLSSVFLSLTEGVGNVPSGQLLKEPWVRHWWDSFETEAVSATKIIDTTQVPKSSFYRHLKLLVRAGLVSEEEVGKGKRYALLDSPYEDHSLS